MLLEHHPSGMAVKKIRKIRNPSEKFAFVYEKKRILSISKINQILSVFESAIFESEITYIYDI